MAASQSNGDENMRALTITLLALVWIQHAHAGNAAIDYLLTTPASKMDVGLVKMNIWLMQNGQQYTSAKFKGGTIVVRYERHDFEGNENGAKAACNKWIDSMQVSKGLLASFFENTISQMPSGVMRPGGPEDLEGRVRELMDLQCSISDKSGAVIAQVGFDVAGAAGTEVIQNTEKAQAVAKRCVESNYRECELPSYGTAQNSGGDLATLYEEPGVGNSSGKAYTTAVVWSLDTSADEAAIVGTIDAREKGLIMTVSIRQNDDETLPASHLIEIRFRVDESFAGMTIDNTHGMFMKNTEQERGLQLLGASAKVSDNYFWLALSNNPVEQQRNEALMLGRGWFDIPLQYGTGRQAIFTVGKGDQGQQIFAAAFAEWAK
jgi:hypothetical protein